MSDWPDIIIKSCIENTSELTNLLAVINGVLRGQTILSMPTEIEFLSQSDYLQKISL